MEKISGQLFMIKKDFLKILPIIILLLAIGLSPRFSVGKISDGRSIDIRIEDICLVIFLVYWTVSFFIRGETKIKTVFLFYPILAWLGAGFFSVLTNLIFGNLILSRAFFFFLKEVEFFLIYYCVFLYIKNIDSTKLLVWFWTFVGLINGTWIAFELLTGSRFTYYYGPTTFIEPQGTLPGGGFMLIIFIFLFNIIFGDPSFFKEHKITAFLTLATLTAGIISSGSRTVFFGLIISIIITAVVYFLRKNNTKKILLMSAILLCIIPASFLVIAYNPYLSRLLNEKSFSKEFSLNSSSINRAETWKTQMSQAINRPLFLIFGFGKSAILTYGESHNQYIRNLIETGIAGSFLFLLIMYFILKASYDSFKNEKEKFKISIATGLFVATSTMLIIALSADVFIVVKIAETYWFFTAMSLAVLNGKDKILS
jgi:hypothetical protein